MWTKFKTVLRRRLRDAARYILANVKPLQDEIDEVVLESFKEVGLPMALYGEDFDLVNERKFYDVLHHSMHKLGQSAVTVYDVKQLLR